MAKPLVFSLLLFLSLFVSSFNTWAGQFPDSHWVFCVCYNPLLRHTLTPASINGKRPPFANVHKSCTN